MDAAIAFDLPPDDPMHVYVEGAWHRRTPDMKRTACGREFHSQFSPTRREELTHPLARCCFTDYEIGKANEIETAKRELLEQG